MKPIGNIAKYLDLRKPASQEDIRKALARAHADQRPKSIRQVAKAGYGLELLRPNIVAQAAGTSLRPLPHFVKE